MLRFLAASMVQRSKSGHLGMPLGMADVCAVLWMKFMNWSSQDPKWPNRDRFILSCGHGSALLYAVLRCMGGLSDHDCNSFRQLHSKTPGHPELDLESGIEVTTGPLGQGIGYGIGMAAAAMRYSSLDHYVYIFCSDGDLMEGVAHEAISLAGLWRCKKCIVFWDDNGITIDGKVSLCNGSDMPAIFMAHGWNVISIDGHDHDAISQAIDEARKSERPTCIQCKTIIGYGLNHANSEKAHGYLPFDMESLKKQLRIDYDVISEEHFDLWKPAIDRGNTAMKKWYDNNPGFKYVTSLPDYQQIYDRLKNSLPAKTSTRKMISTIIREDPELMVGSADLAESTCTQLHHNYINFGVREHGMISIAGGMALYGQRVAVATFLVFTDYGRPSIRLASMMKIPLIIIATHDSVGVGEDGPTHQPIEQLNSYRIMPNIDVWRPANFSEMVAAWASSRNGPSIIACSRQDLVMFGSELSDCLHGAYIVLSAENHQVTLLATGSEVTIAIESARLLQDYNIIAQVVSMPCMEVFERQTDDYKSDILSGYVVSIEAGSTAVWYKYADLCIGIDEFGLSGNGTEVFKEMGITPDAIAERVSTEFTKMSQARGRLSFA